MFLLQTQEAIRSLRFLLLLGSVLQVSLIDTNLEVPSLRSVVVAVSKSVETVIDLHLFWVI